MQLPLERVPQPLLLQAWAMLRQVRWQVQVQTPRWQARQKQEGQRLAVPQPLQLLWSWQAQEWPPQPPRALLPARKQLQGHTAVKGLLQGLLALRWRCGGRWPSPPVALLESAGWIAEEHLRSETASPEWKSGWRAASLLLEGQRSTDKLQSGCLGASVSIVLVQV